MGPFISRRGVSVGIYEKEVRMRIVTIKQNTDAWLSARAGVVTASEVKALVTCGTIKNPGWSARKGEGVTTYYHRKLAERWVGPLASFNGSAAEQGQLLEPEAAALLEIKLDEDRNKEAGFIVSDCGRMGCSPDLWFDVHGGAEIKSLQPPHHVEVLMNGVPDDEYQIQIQYSMWLTGRKSWIFWAYSRVLPDLYREIPRDDAAMKVFDETIPAFCDRLDAGFQKLLEMNNGQRYKVPERPRTDLDRYFDGEFETTNAA